MMHALIEASAFSHDLTCCSRCRGLLTRYDFGTDDLGRTVERCPKCGPALLRIKHHEPVVRDSRVFKSEVIGKCADCPKKLTWRGVGAKAIRCPKCQRKRCNEHDLAAYHERQNRLKKLLA